MSAGIVSNAGKRVVGLRLHRCTISTYRNSRPRQARSITAVNKARALALRHCPSLLLSGQGNGEGMTKRGEESLNPTEHPDGTT